MTINERVERRLIGATQVVQPETILRWHRAGFKAFWWWKSRCRATWTLSVSRAPNRCYRAKQ